MSIEVITSGLFLAALLAAGAVDIWAGATGRHSVTDTIRDWSGRWPALPFVAGFIAGHLWWGR